MADIFCEMRPRKMEFFSELLEKKILKFLKNSNKILDSQNFLWSHKIAQTLSHVLGMNLLDQYFCPKNSQTQKIKEF